MKGKKSSVFLIAGVFLGVSGLILFSGETFAAGVGVAISPLTFELTANPGDVLANKMKIYNPTDSVVSIRMEIEDFTVTGETGEVLIEPAETETYSLARWVKAEPEEFTLEPREQKLIDFYIEVPLTAEPGGHYGSILASTTGSIGKDITSVATAQKVGSLLLLTVAGTVKEELKIKEFSAPSFSEYGPVNFTIRFKNEGTVHVRPRGFVTITNWRDKKVADLEFSQRNVIPGAIRKMEAIWNKKWLIGRYTATLVGSYGTSNNPIEPYVLIFWVFPWKVASGIFLIFAIVSTFFIKTRKRWLLALKILVRGENASR